MSKNYLNDYEIDIITAAIYNDDNKTLLENLPQGIEDSIEGQVVADLSQGQEYYIIPQTTIMLRKDGRVFNVKHIRTIKPVWSPREIIVNLAKVVYKFSDIYKINKWDFNHTEITNRYKDKEWGITASRGYRIVLKDKYGLEI